MYLLVIKSRKRRRRRWRRRNSRKKNCWNSFTIVFPFKCLQITIARHIFVLMSSLIHFNRIVRSFVCSFGRSHQYIIFRFIFFLSFIWQRNAPPRLPCESCVLHRYRVYISITIFISNGVAFHWKWRTFRMWVGCKIHQQWTSHLGLHTRMSVGNMCRTYSDKKNKKKVMQSRKGSSPQMVLKIEFYWCHHKSKAIALVTFVFRRNACTHHRMYRFELWEEKKTTKRRIYYVLENAC